MASNATVERSLTTYAKERRCGWHRVARAADLEWSAACGRTGFPSAEEPWMVVKLDTPPSPYCLDCVREDRLSRNP
ncbi:MAG: hypothetical protein ACRDNK_19935, partial [Solirubrobacteraceae bacterium]